MRGQRFGCVVRDVGPAQLGPAECQIWIALETARFREGVIDEDRRRRDPSYVCKDVFTVCPLIAGARRVPTSDLRGALPRVKKHLPPFNTPVLENALGRAAVAPSEGASLLCMAPS